MDKITTIKGIEQGRAKFAYKYAVEGRNIKKKKEPISKKSTTKKIKDKS